MASPQLENGYTPLANELLEALYRAGLAGREWDLVMCIARGSYGWSQKVAPFSIREAARRLGMHYSHTKRTARDLVARGILRRTGSGILIAKDYETWGPRTVPGTVEGPGDHRRAQGGTKDAPMGGTNLVPTLPLNLTSPQGSRTRKAISKSITKSNIADAPAASASRAQKGNGRWARIRKTDPETDTLLREFSESFQAKLSEPYMIEWGRDRKLMGGLVATFGVASVRAKLAAFFEHGTRETRERRAWTVPEFRRVFPQLVAMQAMGDLG